MLLLHITAVLFTIAVVYWARNNGMLSRLTIFCLLTALSVQSAPSQQQLVSDRVQAALRHVSFDSIWSHASVLAHDSLGGRATGSHGERIAASYIADRLQSYGLKPADRDGWYQRIPMHGSTPLPESRLRLYHSEGFSELHLKQDYLLYKTGAQTIVPLPLPMIFVGYGIIAPEYDYNDYQNLDVSGAIVVFLEGEPESDDESYFDGKRPTHHAIPEMKQRIALSRGARGSVQLPLPRSSGGWSWKDYVQIFSFEDVTLPFNVPSHLSIMLNPACAAELFLGAAWNYQDVLTFDSEGRMRSFPLRSRLSFTGSFRERDFISYNVAGMLEGSDPLLRDSWVICCAHYDHLGIGPVISGDSIYNGLVDNALGVSVALEIARILARNEYRPRRSILFLFVTGEENGLLGSQHYCANPLVPLYQTTACLNIDGIAIIDEFDDIVGVGSWFSTLEQLLHRVAEESGLSLSELPPMVNHLEAFASSDQIAFAQAGIPAMLVMEGTSYRTLGKEEGFRRFIEWGRERYHTPFDDLSQPINSNAVSQHATILLAVLSALADTWEAPQWIRGATYINARLQSLAEER
jgi:hypothetical protein